MATLLWGDATDETALDNLRTCVWSLRRSLHDTDHRVIASDGESIVVNSAALEVDALTFRALPAQSGLDELEAAAKHDSGEVVHDLEIDTQELESWRRGEVNSYRHQPV